MIYASHAHALLYSGFDRAGDLWFARIGYVFPLALVFSIFGISQASLALLSFGASMLLICLAWQIGRELDGERLASIAAIVVATLPLDIVYSTNGHLDLFQAAVASLGVYLLWRSGRVHDGGNALRYAVLAGALFGTAHLIKETAFFFLIPAFWLLRRRTYWSRVSIAVATYAAFIAMEMTSYAIIRGDALARFHLVAAQVDNVRPPGDGTFWARAAELAAGVLSPEGAQFLFIGVVAWLALSGTLWALLRDPERWNWVVIWLAGIALEIAFWPRTLFPYRPALGLYPRFFTGLIVPAALLAAEFFVAVAVRLSRPVAWIGLATVVALNLLCAVINHEEAIRGRAGPEWAHRVLATHPNSIVVTDYRTMQMLSFLARYKAPYEIRYATDQPPPGGTMLLDNERMVASERVWDGAEIPSWWRASLPQRERIVQMSVPPRFSLRGRYRPPDNVTLSRLLP
jgi:hypothetical protein